MKRVVSWALYVALMLALWGMLVPLHAQTPAQDSAKVLRKGLDSLKHELERLDSLRGRAEHAYRRTYHPGRWYAAALMAGIGSNYAFRIDPDPGGYKDAWSSSDKIGHFVAGTFLTERAMMLGVRPRDAVLLTCGGAIGYELSQGYASYRDAVASCSGAVFARGFRWLQRKANGQRR